jgi:type IV pilus assembly protein PilV
MRKLRQNGFSLLEVLVSIFVLALGVIGVAAMQLTALRTAQQSELQTTALQLASEMADRMRSNDTQMKLTDAANLFVNIDYVSADGEPTRPMRLCYAANCSPAELAEFDIYEWKKRVREELPEGRAMVCRDAAPWDSTAGALAWECKPGIGNSASIVIKIGWRQTGRNSGGSATKDTGDAFPPNLAITVRPYTS